MGDAGEGLIDAESRIQERMEDLERARTEKRGRVVQDPAPIRAVESLRLARADLERQLADTSHERRRALITQAIEEIDRRIAQVIAGTSPSA